MASAAPHAHVHGAAKLNVALEGKVLTLQLETPLEAVVGFERLPRTPAERETADRALAKLRDTAALFTPDAAARCQPAPADVPGGLLAPGAKANGKSEHADLDATYRFQCEAPEQLTGLRHTLFDAFAGMKTLEVRVITAKGQRKAALKRPAALINLKP